ncbi:MAG TPA: S9 family peptidase, partial [Acidimicrobiia bacterium]|nr:S9 family peptidase [Acidimicrobiia bacterium]
MPEPAPPVAPARPTRLVHDSDVRVDPWFWLRDRDDPEVLAHLEAENAYTRDALAHLSGLRRELYDEIVGRVQESDTSAPVRRGLYEYFTRTVEGLQYSVHCRRPAGAGGSEGGSEAALPDPFAPPGTARDEAIVLDENALADGHDYFAVGDLAVNREQTVAAYSVDTNGGERYELRFRRLDDEQSDGGALEDVVPDIYYGVAWANDGATIFFTRPDDAMRPWQVWRHTLGTETNDDVLVFQEDDDRFYVGVGRTRSGRFIEITTASKVTSEVWLVDADAPRGDPVVVESRQQGHEYHVEHHAGPAGDRLFVLTNADGAENFSLAVTPLATPARASWTTVLPHRDDTRLDDVDAFAGFLVVSERADAVERLRVLALGDDGAVTDDHVLEMPEPVYSAWLGGNPEYDATTVRYQYTSLVSPASAYDYDSTTRAATLVKRQPVPGFDPDRYESRREWATASDGTRVPISLVSRRDLRGEGPSPMLLYGYGSYEVSIDPTFSASRVSLLDRGVVFAIAHVRGGGELGRRWYDDGKLLRKTNTFTDFIACAEHLVHEGWTSPDRLAARGGSAGGLLMGAVANLRPDLFRAIVAEVPFVDCLTTILDEELPLTITEWEEWGDPVHDVAVYDLMKSYSPYDNVEPKDYPALL